MKNIFYYYSILVVLAFWQVFADTLQGDDWGAATNGLQMSISLDGSEKQIKSRQSCNLLIRYRTISTNKTFFVWEAYGTVDDPSYSFVITSPSGKDISPDMTKVHRAFSGTFRIVRPGQIVEIKHFNLNGLCNLDEVGVYKIVAKRKDILLLGENKKFGAVSNPLNVVVVPNQ